MYKLWSHLREQRQQDRVHQKHCKMPVARLVAQRIHDAVQRVHGGIAQQNSTCRRRQPLSDPLHQLFADNDLLLCRRVDRWGARVSVRKQRPLREPDDSEYGRRGQHICVQHVTQQPGHTSLDTQKGRRSNALVHERLERATEQRHKLNQGGSSKSVLDAEYFRNRSQWTTMEIGGNDDMFALGGGRRHG